MKLLLLRLWNLRAAVQLEATAEHKPFFGIFSDFSFGAEHTMTCSAAAYLLLMAGTMWFGSQTDLELKQRLESNVRQNKIC